MIKLIASCAWVCLLTAAAGYATIFMKLDHAAASVPADKPQGEALEYKKLTPINVPMIADGAVQGYVVAQLGYTYNQNLAKLTVPPDVYLMDEAFRKIYADTTLDFHHLERYDVNGLTRQLAQRVNDRLHMTVVKDVLVQELNFFPKSDISR
jgi:flagellar basal body-associated protein FliL